MSDDDLLSGGLRARSADDARASESAPALTAGKLLRRAREAQGLHIAALAVSLKVPVRRLEDLEADRHQELPGAVFTRALASSVCRSVKIDPQPVLDLLPQASTPALAAVEPSLNEAFRGMGSDRTGSSMASVGRPAAFAVVALLLASAVLVGWPWLLEIMPSLGDPSVAPPAASQALPPQVLAEPAVQLPAAETGLAAPALPMASAPPPTPAVHSAKAVELQGAATPGVLPAVSESSNAELSLKARGTVWVKVLDAQGAVLVSKTLYAGDALPVSGSSPLSVVLGKADVVDVTVRGKAFDVLAVARDNVARFEVK